MGLQARRHHRQVERRGVVLRGRDRLVVEARVRQVRDVDGDGLARSRGGLLGVEGQEDGLEPSERFAERDAGQVDAGDNGHEADDDELEKRVARLEGVVEPAAEAVIAGAGVGLAEEGGDSGGGVGVVEEAEAGVRRG